MKGAQLAAWLAVQGVTFLSAVLFFRKCFGKEGRVEAIVGVLLYLTCPYRLFVCRDTEETFLAITYALLPFYGLLLMQVGGRYRKAVLLAGGLSAPLLILGVRYVLAPIFGPCDPTGQSIMPYGYQFGEFFSAYAYAEGHPGLGLLLMAGLGAMLWRRLVEGRRSAGKETAPFLWLAVWFAVCSLRIFPWEWVQRIGKPFLIMIGMFRTPAFFWGLSCACLCVPAAEAVAGVWKEISDFDDTGL